METTNQITITKQTRLDSVLLDQVERTYISSFPVDERRDFNLIKDLIANNPSFNLYTFDKGGQYLGFISIWDFPEFLYVEHFAIESAQRSGGIGSLALSQLLDSSTKPIILEVEPPIDDMAKRRIAFYKRHGFELHPDYYMQPPYREDLNWIELKLMFYGEINLDILFEKVKETLYTYVYQVVL